MFLVAKRHAPAVILLDECDKILTPGKGENKGETDGVIREFQEQLNELIHLQSDVVIICGTNYPTKIDPAAMDRLQSKMYVPLPTGAQLAHLIKKFCVTPTHGEVLYGIDIEEDVLQRFAAELASRFFNVRSTENLCDAAITKANDKAVSITDLQSCTASIIPTATAEVIAVSEEYLARNALSAPAPVPTNPPSTSLQQQLQGQQR